MVHGMPNRVPSHTCMSMLAVPALCGVLCMQHAFVSFEPHPDLDLDVKTLHVHVQATPVQWTVPFNPGHNQRIFWRDF